MSISLAYMGPAPAASEERSPPARTSAANDCSSNVPSGTTPDRAESAYRDWLEAMARQDEAALSSFYDATVGRVYGLALRITRQHECAAEVVSDVYFQAWREAGRYDAKRGKAMAWLMTICRSRALDLLRRADAAETHPDPESLRPEAPEQDTVHDLLTAVQDNSALQCALAKLEPIQRQLVALAFFRGMSHQEIAAHARLPLGTVKTYIRKAMSVMREHLPGRQSAKGQK